MRVLMKTGFALMKSLALLVNEDGAVNCAYCSVVAPTNN